MPVRQYRVLRDVAADDEGSSALRDIAAGEVLYECLWWTYGCVRDGLTLTEDPRGGYPFFEFPIDAAEEIK